MSLCPECGMQFPRAHELCPWHVVQYDGWARGNRLFCDFVHRKIIHPEANPPDDAHWARLLGLRSW